jgi:hypothetical protein
LRLTSELVIDPCSLIISIRSSAPIIVYLGYQHGMADAANLCVTAMKPAAESVLLQDWGGDSARQRPLRRA